MNIILLLLLYWWIMLEHFFVDVTGIETFET
jgi:hypothetical protein